MDLIEAPEVTQDYVHIPVRNKSDFQQDSFRTITISKSKGILALIGKLKGKSTTTVYKYMFARSKGWTMKTAKEWVSKHKGDLMVNKCFMSAKVDKLLNVDKPDELIKANEDGDFKDFDPTTRYKFEVDFVHEGKNKNGAVFTKDEIEKSYQTPIHQYVDWEHDQGAIIGAIANSRIAIQDDSTRAIKVESVLWPMSPYIQFEGRLNRILKRYEDGNLYASMECWFDDCTCAECQYKAQSIFDFFYHCQTEHENIPINEVGYILNGVKFAGMGIVEFPADPEANVEKLIEGAFRNNSTSDYVSENCGYITFEQILSNGLEKYNFWVTDSIVPTEYVKIKDFNYYVKIKDNNYIVGSEDKDEKTKEEGVKWTRKYINDLEDDCFAVVEPGYPKETDNKNARHLPHHSKGHGNNSGSVKLDLPHYRNALARANQINPITKSISVSELRSKASKHLEAHRKIFEKEKGFLNYINGENMLKEKINDTSTFDEIVNVYNEELKKVLESEDITVDSKVMMVVELSKEFIEFSKNKIEDANKKLDEIIKTNDTQITNLSSTILSKDEEIKNLKTENESLKLKVDELTKEKESKDTNSKIVGVFDKLSKDGIELTEDEKKPIEETLRNLVKDEKSFETFVDSFIRAYKIAENIKSSTFVAKTGDDKSTSIMPNLEKVEKEHKTKKE